MNPELFTEDEIIRYRNLKRIYAEKLYLELANSNFLERSAEKTDLGENMSCLKITIAGWWKPRYLIDEENRRAYEIMNSYTNFTNFTKSDIDWDSIGKLPEEARERAQYLDAHFPTFIHQFKNGVAEVSWQLNPDGRYYMDDDGYGMTPDEEITVYAFIDREMNILTKFRYIGRNWDLLEEIRKEAEAKLTKTL